MFHEELSLLLSNISTFLKLDVLLFNPIFSNRCRVHVCICHNECTPWAIKTWHFILSLSLPIIDQFLKFFHWCTLQTICNNVIIIYPTTLQLLATLPCKTSMFKSDQNYYNAYPKIIFLKKCTNFHTKIKLYLVLDRLLIFVNKNREFCSQY